MADHETTGNGGQNTVVFVLGGPGYEVRLRFLSQQTDKASAVTAALTAGMACRSGKGTQCSRIAASGVWAHFSAGDLLRAEARSESQEVRTFVEVLVQTVHWSVSVRPHRLLANILWRCFVIPLRARVVVGCRVPRACVRPGSMPVPPH